MGFATNFFGSLDIGWKHFDSSQRYNVRVYNVRIRYVNSQISVQFLLGTIKFSYC